LLAHDRQRRVRTSAGSRWLLGLPGRLESSCQARFSDPRHRHHVAGG
jgi:hypothetical protein